MPSEYTQMVILNAELRRKVKLAAQAETVSVSAIVRKALLQYFLLHPVAGRDADDAEEPARELTRV